MRFSLGRGAIFRKNHLSMLELQKQSFGGALGEAFWGRKWKQNQKNEVRMASYLETSFCVRKKHKNSVRGGGAGGMGNGCGEGKFWKTKHSEI